MLGSATLMNANHYPMVRFHRFRMTAQSAQGETISLPPSPLPPPFSRCPPLAHLLPAAPLPVEAHVHSADSLSWRSGLVEEEQRAAQLQGRLRPWRLGRRCWSRASGTSSRSGGAAAPPAMARPGKGRQGGGRLWRMAAAGECEFGRLVPCRFWLFGWEGGGRGCKGRVCGIFAIPRVAKRLLGLLSAGCGISALLWGVGPRPRSRHPRLADSCCSLLSLQFLAGRCALR